MTDTSGTVARALSVLTVIAEAKARVGVKDVAGALKLPMSTSHRLLDLLLDAGFVEKDEARRRYGVGAEFFRVASLVAQNTSYAILVQPSLDRITEATGETALYSVYLPAQHAMMYTAKRDSPNSLRFRIPLFQQISLDWGSAALAILAYLTPEAQTAVFERAQPSPVSRKRLSRIAFAERIKTVRENGYSLTESERLPDSVGIAAPVMMSAGKVTGSIVLAIPKVRYDPKMAENYVELVKREAARCAAGD
jgi:DNA-binding IclR family transcriptional regulator